MALKMFSEYGVDVVLCIDATGSMAPHFRTVRERALSFCGVFTKVMTKINKRVTRLRVRVIAFRGYLSDGDRAMVATDFFDLPEQAAGFEAYVNRIEPTGGDGATDGLEALACAMLSDWDRREGLKRHIIVLWTGNGAHELGFGRQAPNYPEWMAGDFSELTEWWGAGCDRNAVMDRRAKRLLIFAPTEEPWTTIASCWDNTILFPAEDGRYPDDDVLEEILTYPYAQP